MGPSIDALARAFERRAGRLAVFDVTLRKETAQWFLERPVPLTATVARLTEHGAFRDGDGGILLPLHAEDSAALTGEYLRVDVEHDRVEFEDPGIEGRRRLPLAELAYTYPAWRVRFWTDEFEPPHVPAFVVEFGDVDPRTDPLGPAEATAPQASEDFFEAVRSAVVSMQERERTRMRERFEHLPTGEFVDTAGGIAGLVPGERTVDEYGQQSVRLSLPVDHAMAGQSADAVRRASGLRPGDEVIVSGEPEGLPVEAELFEIDGKGLELGIYWDSARGGAAERALEPGSDTALAVGKLVDGRRFRTIADAIETVEGTEHARARYAGTAEGAVGPLPEVDAPVALNRDQRVAVGRALGAEDVLTVHAPPWTGARRVIAAIVDGAVDAGERVLVLSPDLATLLEHPIEGHLGESVPLFGDRAVLLAPASGEADADAPVVAATPRTAETITNHEVELAVVDQAGRVDVPTGAIPFAKAARVVAVGDPHQGGPPAAPVDNDMPGSLFVHLRDRYPSTSSGLRCQYHMHPAIAQFPNREFYDGALVHGGEGPRDTIGPLAPFSAVQVDQDLRRTPTGTVFHDDEIETVLAEVRRLRDYGVPEDGIGILAATSGQVGKLRGALAGEAETGPSGILIGGPEAFRCLGRSAVIVSFVGDGRRFASEHGSHTPETALNVMLTRAATRLVLIGDWSAIPDVSPSHRALVTFLEERGLIDRAGG